MRISDWSSDVCSSDLPFLFICDTKSGVAETAGLTCFGFRASRFPLRSFLLITFTLCMRRPQVASWRNATKHPAERQTMIGMRALANEVTEQLAIPDRRYLARTAPRPAEGAQPGKRARTRRGGQYE